MIPGFGIEYSQINDLKKLAGDFNHLYVFPIFPKHQDTTFSVIHPYATLHIPINGKSAFFLKKDDPPVRNKIIQSKDRIIKNEIPMSICLIFAS